MAQGKQKNSARRRWFHGESPARNPLLEVSARGMDRRGRRLRWLLAGLAAAAGLAALLLFARFMAVSFHELLFQRNARYAVRTLDIRSDGKLITADLVQDWTGLRPGLNLFATDIVRLREDILRKAPQVRSMEITRRMPDALEIRISERVAVARLDGPRHLVVDSDGCVFVQRTGTQGLPMITGLHVESPAPGANIRPMVQRALEVIDVCNQSLLGQALRIAVLDVSQEDSLRAYLDGGECARLPWLRSESGPEAREELQRKLRMLVRTLQSSAYRGKRIQWVDLTYTDENVPAQEY